MLTWRFYCPPGKLVLLTARGCCVKCVKRAWQKQSGGGLNGNQAEREWAERESN